MMSVNDPYDPYRPHQANTVDLQIVFSTPGVVEGQLVGYLSHDPGAKNPDGTLFQRPDWLTYGVEANTDPPRLEEFQYPATDQFVAQATAERATQAVGGPLSSNWKYEVSLWVEPALLYRPAVQWSIADGPILQTADHLNWNDLRAQGFDVDQIAGQRAGPGFVLTDPDSPLVQTSYAFSNVTVGERPTPRPPRMPATT